jgi:type II secretory ATPase GspE/PulE/Tfp pilus assembly ATPase PilB-like protein
MLLPSDRDAGRAILTKGDVDEIETAAAAAGMTTIWRRALNSVEAGLTSPAEVRRVLGMRG